jgi:hypothetical protein
MSMPFTWAVPFLKPGSDLTRAASEVAMLAAAGVARGFAGAGEASAALAATKDAAMKLAMRRDFMGVL